MLVKCSLYSFVTSAACSRCSHREWHSETEACRKADGCNACVPWKHKNGSWQVTGVDELPPGTMRLFRCINSNNCGVSECPYKYAHTHPQESSSVVCRSITKSRQCELVGFRIPSEHKEENRKLLKYLIAQSVYNSLRGFMEYLLSASELEHGGTVRVPSKIISRWVKYLNIEFDELPKIEKRYSLAIASAILDLLETRGAI